VSKHRQKLPEDLTEQVKQVEEVEEAEAEEECKD